MSNEDGWYVENPTEKDIENVRKEASRGFQTRRFYLKAKETKKIIVVDDDPFGIWEHNPKIHEEFWHYFTCRVKVDGDCPLCQSRKKRTSQRTFHSLVTVLDATGWINQEKKKILYTRQLFPMTLKSLERFDLLKTKETSLVGAQFELTRSSKDEVKVGDMWSFAGITDLDNQKYWYESKVDNKMKAPEPFNYKKIFQPVSADEMRIIDGTSTDDSGKAKGGGTDGGSEGGGDDDSYY